jgi:DNA-binding NarL/FixJ family response regulator
MVAKLLVADDHALICEAVTDAFKACGPGFEVSCVHDGLSLLGFLELNLETDAVIVDHDLPGLREADLLALVRERFPDVKIVVLTDSNDESVLQRARQLGINGWARKLETGEDLVRIVEKAIHGEEAFSVADEKARMSRPTLFANTSAGSSRLTHRQLEILALLADGFSNREIAESLDLSENTVKVHVHAVLKLLGARNRTQAVAAARKASLVPL